MPGIRLRSTSEAGSAYAGEKAFNISSLPPDHPGNGTFQIFSVLHDPTGGYVRIVAEAFLASTCKSADTCTFTMRGNRTVFSVPAEEHVCLDPPSESLQLRECIFLCTVPFEGLQLQRVTIRDNNDVELKSHDVEEVAKLAEGTKKGVGVCAGPNTSRAPTAPDWIDYYTDLGVSGIHLYDTMADAEKSSYLAKQSESHHLVTWTQHIRSSQYSALQSSQGLIYNDCIFRHRNVYDYILMPDMDEFMSLPQQSTQPESDLAQIFDTIFAPLGIASDVEYASATYYTAMYRVHCHMEKAEPVASGEPGEGARDLPGRWTQIPTYSGYDVRAINHTAPDFHRCHASGDCLPKIVLRPLAVDVVGAHQIIREMPGYEVTKEAAPQLLFSKQLRCLEGPDGSWNLDRNGPLCPDSKTKQPVEDQSGAVPECPGESVTLRQARRATDARISWDAVFGAQSAA